MFPFYWNSGVSNSPYGMSVERMPGRDVLSQKLPDEILNAIEERRNTVASEDDIKEIIRQANMRM